MLERAEAELGLRFVRAAGIVHRAQPPETLARVKALALGLDDFGLTGLAFGAAPVRLGGPGASPCSAAGSAGEAAFELSRLDEAWQEEQWGVDAEAAERDAAARRGAMLDRWFEARKGRTARGRSSERGFRRGQKREMTPRGRAFGLELHAVDLAGRVEMHDPDGRPALEGDAEGVGAVCSPRKLTVCIGPSLLR